MNIPKHWEEYILPVEHNNKTIKIRRYGWSDVDTEQAKKHALSRCETAQETLLATGQIQKIETRKQYDDIPIREQIVERYDTLNAITSINSYGAICLNVKDVMVLDIDYWDLEAHFKKTYPNNSPKHREVVHTAIQVTLVASIIMMLIGFWFIGTKALILSLVSACTVFLLTLYVTDKKNTKVHKLWLTKQGEHYGLLQQLLTPFFVEHKQAKFNVYETPLGLRLIALQDTFQATDEQTQRYFDELPVDTRYATMCKVQDCFRARLTGKPWRMGIDDKPAQNFWQDEAVSDKNAQQLTQRKQWLENYQKIAPHYRSCQFIDCVGNLEIATDEKVAKVVALHDELAQCHQSLPLA